MGSPSDFPVSCRNRTDNEIDCQIRDLEFLYPSWDSKCSTKSSGLTEDQIRRYICQKANGNLHNCVKFDDQIDPNVKQYNCSIGKTEKIIIMGAGPTGLMTAILLLKKSRQKGKKVIISVFENRRKYTREQIVALSGTIVDFLAKWTPEVKKKIWDSDTESSGCYIYWPPNDHTGKCYGRQLSKDNSEGFPAEENHGDRGGWENRLASVTLKVLEEELRGLARSLGIRIHYPRSNDHKLELVVDGGKISVVEVKVGDKKIKFDNLYFDYLIGCDGRNSQVATKAMGDNKKLINRRTKNYLSYGLIAMFNSPSQDKFSIPNDQPPYHYTDDRELENNKLKMPFIGDNVYQERSDHEINFRTRLSALLRSDGSNLLFRGFRSRYQKQPFYLGININQEIYNFLHDVLGIKTPKDGINAGQKLLNNRDTDIGEKIIELIKMGLEYYQMDKNSLNGQMTLYPFMMDLKKREKSSAIFKFSNGKDGKVFLAGDANLGVHFFTGVGLVSGIIQADILSEIILSDLGALKDRFYHSNESYLGSQQFRLPGRAGVLPVNRKVYLRFVNDSSFNSKEKLWQETIKGLNFSLVTNSLLYNQFKQEGNDNVDQLIYFYKQNVKRAKEKK